MKRYPALAVERTMKVQEVILRAMSGEILWMQAAETERPYRILGITPRSMLRWKQQYDKHGYDGLLDRRTQQPNAAAGETLD